MSHAGVVRRAGAGGSPYGAGFDGTGVRRACRMLASYGVLLSAGPPYDLLVFGVVVRRAAGVGEGVGRRAGPAGA
ncbi:hypothetical protein ACWCOV_34705 [Kribbella sp. NPDC002412]